MAEPTPGQPSLPSGAAREVVRLGISRADVARYQIVDTDIVVTLKNGRKVLIPDGAVKTMLDPDFALSYTDGDVLGTEIMQNAGPLEINQVTTTTVGGVVEGGEAASGVIVDGASAAGDAAAASSSAASAATTASAVSTAAEVAKASGGFLSTVKSVLPWVSAAGSIGGVAVAAGGGGGGGDSDDGGGGGTVVIIPDRPDLFIDSIGDSWVINATGSRSVTGITTDNTGPVILQLGADSAFATIEAASFPEFAN